MKPRARWFGAFFKPRLRKMCKVCKTVPRRQGKPRKTRIPPPIPMFENSTEIPAHGSEDPTQRSRCSHPTKHKQDQRARVQLPPEPLHAHPRMKRGGHAMSITTKPTLPRNINHGVRLLYLYGGNKSEALSYY